MTIRPVRFLCLVLFIILLISSVPATAKYLTYTYLGTVTGLDPAADTITIEATHEWGCVFDAGEVICDWSEIDPQEMVSGVPVTELYSRIGIGDTVEVVGVPDAEWNAIGLICDDPMYGYVVTDLFGDLGNLPNPLDEGYTISATNYPDCDSCDDAVCTAEYSSVTIGRNDQERWTGDLYLGDEHTYYDPTDLSSVFVKFVSGQTSASLCHEHYIIGVPIESRFVVHVNPPYITPATTGSVIISSHPLGASAYLDQQYLGVTPLTKSGIESGVHSLLIEKEGYDLWDSEVTVREGRVASIIARLSPLYGVLDVRSVPSGAEILVDGIASGYTPEKIDVTPGVHTVTLSKEGYYPADITTRTSAGRLSMIYRVLRPEGSYYAM